MDITHGISLFFLGCTVTVIGFFTAFLVINYNKKKEEEKIREQNKPKVHLYGDDTV